MTRFFWMREDRTVAARHGGNIEAWNKWGLPDVRCHTCGATWSDAGHDYPCVDLSQLAERRAFEKARPEPFPEFARLRELVRPLAPPDAELPPGTEFGTLVGHASGDFGPIVWVGEQKLLVRRDVLERLQMDGVQGLLGCRPDLRFRKKDAPELLELQIEPRGRLHPDCIPPEVPPPCPTCGRHGFSRSDEPILDEASLPTELDLFRVGKFAVVMIGTKHLMEAIHRLELDGIIFSELPVR